MSLAQTPPGLPLTRRLSWRARWSGATGEGLPSLGKVRDGGAPLPHERACLVYAGAGGILPLFCPTDLHRAARTRTTLNDQPSRLSLTRADVTRANHAGRPRTRDTRLKTARSAVRADSRPSLLAAGDDSRRATGCHARLPGGWNWRRRPRPDPSRCRVGDLGAGPHTGTHSAATTGCEATRNDRAAGRARATPATTATAPSRVGRRDRPGNIDCCPSAARGGRIRSG